MANLDPKYSIGIPEMDAQHARWIQLIERFRAAASDHMLEQAGLDAAAHALEKLLEYTQCHFTSEERFLADRRYPGIDDHRRTHRELEAKVVALLGEIRAHKTNTTPLKLNLFVTVWLMEHIMQEDDKYARFLRGKS